MQIVIKSSPMETKYGKFPEIENKYLIISITFILIYRGQRDLSSEWGNCECQNNSIIRFV